MPNYRIVVEIDPKRARTGRRAVSGELNAIERQAGRVQSALTRAFAFAGISLGIGGLVRLADEYTNLQNRIRVVTNGQEELEAVTGRLFDIANKTRSSFAATTEVYARTALAAKDLGISQQEVIDFTESLNQAIAIGGSTAAEANNAMIQLSQGLASGALRGDELRSVLEQLPVVADVIADELGVTRGELRKMGEDGAITADIILEAFRNASDDLEQRFGQTVPTIGQSFEVLKNNLTGLVGEFLTGSGVTETFASALLGLANNLDLLARASLALGVIYTANMIPAALASVSAWTASTTSALQLFAAVKSGNAVMLGSAAAQRMQAIAAAESAVATTTANAEAAASEVARMQAILATTRAEQSKALVTTESNVATFQRISAERTLAAQEALLATAQTQSTAATTAHTAALGRLNAAQNATIARNGLLAASFGLVRSAVNVLTVAIAANPLGALAVALTATISLLYVFSDEIKVSEDGLVTLGDVAAATWDIIVEGISSVTDFLRSAWEAAVTAVNAVLEVFGTTFSAVISGILDFAKAAINAYIGLWTFAYRAVTLAWNNAPGFFDAVFTTIVNLGASAAESLLNAWQTPLRGIAGALSLLDDEAGAALSGFLDNLNINVPRRTASAAGQQFAQDLQEVAASSFSEDYIGNALGEIMARARARALARQNEGGDVDLTGSGEAALIAGEADDAAARRARGTKEQTDELEQQLQVLADWFKDTEQEIALLGMSARERERAQELYRLENDLKRELTITERELVDARLDELQAARDAATLRDVLDDLDRENDLLTTNVEEREARAEILRVEARLGRELNEIEAESIRQRIEQNRAISDANNLFDTLNDRRRETIRQLEAIQRLRSSASVGDETGQPAISELDARNAREGLGLVQDLRGVDDSLGGDYAFEAELERIQAYEDERMAIVRDAEEAGLIFRQEAADRRVAIEEDTQRRISDLRAAERSVALNAAQSTAESLASIAKDSLGEQSRIYRAMFIASKAFAIADSIIKIQQGIANALALPFPANLGAVAVVAAQAASIVSNIKAISLQFADGGLVRGPGTGTSDSIPAMVSNGEYVVNAKATGRYLGLLEAINSGRDPVAGFSEGGPVSANDNFTGVTQMRTTSSSRGGGAAPQLNVKVENYTDATVQVERLGPNDVRIIARNEAKKVLSEDLGDSFAAEMSQPNSRAREAVINNTDARPSR